MKKAALLGGSFDPVHEGHLAIARAALEQLGVDEVWLIPSNSTPLKSRMLTPVNHRLAMLRIALENEPAMKICDVDLKRNGVSYSVDTLRILHENFPEVEFTWLIGADQARQFEKWKEPEELLHLAHFAVVDRDGASIADSPYPFEHLAMDPVPVSSTDIRKGDRLNYLPEGVLRYIFDHELYLKSWLPSRMSPHRYVHSCSVASLCRKLAAAHHLDEHKAWLAGLFHDIAKDLPQEEMRKWIAACFPPAALKEHHAIWHGYAGSVITARIFGLQDPVICNAIANHVKGTSYDPYAMIVFIADKLDPSRGYDSSALIEACMQDLYNGFMLVRRENKAFLEKEKRNNGRT